MPRNDSLPHICASGPAEMSALSQLRLHFRTCKTVACDSKRDRAVCRRTSIVRERRARGESTQAA